MTPSLHFARRLLGILAVLLTVSIVCTAFAIYAAPPWPIAIMALAPITGAHLIVREFARWRRREYLDV